MLEHSDAHGPVYGACALAAVQTSWLPHQRLPAGDALAPTSSPQHTILRVARHEKWLESSHWRVRVVLLGTIGTDFQPCSDIQRFLEIPATVIAFFHCHVHTAQDDARRPVKYTYHNAKCTRERLEMSFRLIQHDSIGFGYSSFPCLQTHNAHCSFASA